MKNHFLVASLACILHLAIGSRVLNTAAKDARVPSNAKRSYKVHLLVTRHGLSCANIVEKWGSSYDFGRGLMLDPPLGGLGEFGARAMRPKVEAWMASNNLHVDAVVSSNLGRAIHTAILMYPRDDPLYIVPFIREHARGESNRPAPQRDQVNALKEVINSTFHVNYKWIDVFGGQQGSWEASKPSGEVERDSFEHFLTESFLPDLIGRLGKQPDSDIVIPVVTHSNFMRDSVVGNICKERWASKGASKALNNQVLRVMYTFTEESPPADSSDVTPRRSLKMHNTCDEAAEGLPADNKNQSICMSDIGSKCVELVGTYAFTSNTIWEKTVEREIVNLAHDRHRDTQKLEDLKKEKEMKTLALAELEKRGPVNCKKERTWSGPSCSPSESCQLEGRTCVAKAVLLRQAIQVIDKKAIPSVIAQLEAHEAEQSNLKHMQCRGGGNPNAFWYERMSGHTAKSIVSTMSFTKT